MYIPFEQLSDQARIWIYQADRLLKQEEKDSVLEEAHIFLAQWATHGNPLQSSATLLHDQFLVIAVEESFQGATGCAVDASIRFVRSLENTFKITLMDRGLIVFREGGANKTIALPQLQGYMQQGNITATTPVFDNTVTRKHDLATKWLIPAKNAWVARYF